MYKLSLVKKKKKVRRAAIITSIGAIGVTAMVIVAFLGRTVGTFTVNLHGDGVELALSEHSDFAEQSTHLTCRGLTNFSGLQTYNSFVNTRSFRNIHNENTDYTLGQETYGEGDDQVTTMRFFKYTFFIKNIGDYAASYDLEINLIEKNNPTNKTAAPIEQYLRLAVFEGIEEEESKKENPKDVYLPRIFAYHSLQREQANLGVTPEYVASGPEDTTNFHGEAEVFVDDNMMCRITDDINVGDMKMYTLLLWLEGWDPEAINIPKNGSLRIGANINAYHQKDKQ